MKLSILITTVLSSLAYANQCVPAREDISFPHVGNYHRIHPSGNFFMYTEGHNSHLVDITDRSKPKLIKTPMREESYPVEAADGGWNLLASPKDGGQNGPEGGMNYYTFNGLIENGKEAQPTYTDPNHGQYYLSSAEMAGSTREIKKVRTLLYKNRIYQDYEMKMRPDGTVESAEKLGKKKLCENLFPTIERTPEAIAEFEKAESDIERLEKQKDKREFADQMRKELYAKYYGPDFIKLLNRHRELDSEETSIDKQIRQLPEMVKIQGEISDLNRQYDDVQEKIRNAPAYKKHFEDNEKLQERLRSASDQEREKIQAQINESNKKSGILIDKLNDQLGGTKIKQQLELATKKKNQFEANEPLVRKLAAVIEEKEVITSKMWDAKDGRILSQPILSKDGSYVAGLAGNTMRVFKIDENGNCEEVFNTKMKTNKVSFSYPESGKAPKITFTTPGTAASNYQDTAHLYDLETKKLQKLSAPQDEGVHYPGFTKDGRVMFKTKKGMTIVDPNQQPDSSQNCIRSVKAESGTKPAAKEGARK